MISINFLYSKINLLEDSVRKYNVPTFSINSAYAGHYNDVKDLNLYSNIYYKDFSISENNVLCSNEIFPESAIHNPINDLLIYNEWLNGLRKFPYPGIFNLLDIDEKESKIPSTSSLGVLGEIIAGIFAQNIVSPFVLVRCIRTWPDFIFAKGGSNFSFIESKCSSIFYSNSDNPLERVEKREFQEALCSAAKNILAYNNIKVFYCFTNIEYIDTKEIRLAVTFVEISCDELYQDNPDSYSLHPRMEENLARIFYTNTIEEIGQSNPEIIENLKSKKGGKNKERYNISMKNVKEEMIEKLEDYFSIFKVDVPSNIYDSISNKTESFNAIPTSENFRDIYRKKDLLKNEGAYQLWKDDNNKKIFYCPIPQNVITEQITKFQNPRYEKIDFSINDEEFRCANAILKITEEDLTGNILDSFDRFF